MKLALSFEQKATETTERFSLLPPLAPVQFGAARWGVSFRLFCVFRGATAFNAETRRRKGGSLKSLLFAVQHQEIDRK